MKLQFRGLHAHLAWNLLEFMLWGCMKIKLFASTVYNREELWRLIQKFESEIRNTSGIFECFRISFSLIAELSVREHGGHLEHFLHESENEEVINSSFICLYHHHRLQPFKLKKYLWFVHRD
jgi:hypothetical protein